MSYFSNVIASINNDMEFVCNRHFFQMKLFKTHKHIVFISKHYYFDLVLRFNLMIHINHSCHIRRLHVWRIHKRQSKYLHQHHIRLQANQAIAIFVWKL